MAAGNVLDDLAGYLEFEIDEGRREMELSPEEAQKIRSLKSAPARAPATPKPAAAAVPARAAAASKPTPPPPAPPVPAMSPGLARIAAEVSGCTKCALHKTRTKTVPGQGNPSPEIMFIGEAPGEDEDKQGLAFVGRAGQLLTKMIEAMGYTRDQVFIGNILKCRPPNNRPPLPEEMETCIPYLKEQIKLLKPKVIVALGATAVKGLMKTETGITKLRGTWLTYEGVDFMPTFHPAYLLRNPPAKKEAWDDLKAVLTRLGRTPPPVKKPPQV